MDSFRLFLAEFLIVILPVVIVFWLFIHAIANRARAGMSTRLVYLLAGTLILICLVVVRINIEFLSGVDLGFSWLLFVVGAVIYLFSHIMAMPIRKHLTLRTFAGIPEVAGEDVELLEDGPYSVVRHPRYLMVIVGVIGWAMMANYSGAYVVSLLSLGGLYLVMWMEERDLVARFGQDYKAYQTRVPQIIPRPGTFKRYFEAPKH